MRKAIFLDKDGVINELVQRMDGRLTSPWTLDEFKKTVFTYTQECIKIIKDNGYMALVVTNQPGVIDGEMKIEELDSICRYLEDELGADHVLYALRKNTLMYKPNNGMIESFIRMYHIDREKSFLVGDRWKDVVAGQKSGLTTIYCNTKPYVTEEPNDNGPDYQVNDLKEAVKLIMEKK